MNKYYRILGIFWSLMGITCIMLVLLATMPNEDKHFLTLASLLSMLMSDNYYDKASS